MCGRARCALAPDRVLQAAGLPGRHERWRDAERYRPSHNLAPGAYLPVFFMQQEDPLPMVQCMKWGLVPSFSKGEDKPDHWKMFNARSETVCEKPVFSRLVKHKRCVIPLEGFFEWRKEGSKKQPYFVHLGGKDVMLVAGLYDCCQGPDGEPLFSCTLITTDNSQPLAWLHDRMPVVLPDEGAVQAWLHGAKGDGDATKLVEQLCRPYAGSDLAWHPVTPSMTNLRYDKPDASEDLRAKKGTISSFFGKQQTKGAGIAGKEVKVEKGMGEQKGKGQVVKEESGGARETILQMGLKKEVGGDNGGGLGFTALEGRAVEPERLFDQKTEEESAYAPRVAPQPSTPSTSRCPLESPSPSSRCEGSEGSEGRCRHIMMAEGKGEPKVAVEGLQPRGDKVKVAKAEGVFQQGQPAPSPASGDTPGTIDARASSLKGGPSKGRASSAAKPGKAAAQPHAAASFFAPRTRKAAPGGAPGVTPDQGEASPSGPTADAVLEAVNGAPRAPPLAATAAVGPGASSRMSSQECSVAAGLGAVEDHGQRAAAGAVLGVVDGQRVEQEGDEGGAGSCTGGPVGRGGAGSHAFDSRPSLKRPRGDESEDPGSEMALVHGHAAPRQGAGDKRMREGG